MEAKVENKSGVAIVKVSGRLEMDKTKPLHQVCLQQFGGKKVVFSLDELSFVGSSGIKNFLQIFRDLKNSNTQVKLVGLNADFQRFIQMTESPLEVEIHDSLEKALMALVSEETTRNLDKG